MSNSYNDNKYIQRNTGGRFASDDYIHDREYWIAQEGNPRLSLGDMIYSLYPGKSIQDAMAGAGAAPNPMTLNLDLTSSLPSSITFARAGTRNYINNGVLTALATGTPAFESWGGVNRGLAIEPGFTNVLTYSNDLTQAIYTKSGGAITAGDAAVGLVGPFNLYTATATNAYHYVQRQTAGHAAGSTQTLSCFVKAAAGATNYSVRLRMSNQYNNNGPTVFFRLDGSDGFMPILDTTIATNVTYGYRKLSGGVYQIWITGTWVSTGNKEFDIGVTTNALLTAAFYTAAVTDAVQIANVQWATANGPTGHVVTGAGTASQAAESAIFNDTSWLTSTSQGTFVIEHDCWSGPLIGSGANTVLSATVQGKTAIAWSGVTSDTVSNGGAASAGVQPTFSGSDVRLLATSSTTNAGHIKSIRFYPTRLSVAELQALTTPTVTSTANLGALRTVARENRALSFPHTTTGTVLTQQTRFKYTLGASESYTASELRINLSNIRFAAMSAVGNNITVVKLALERETGVVEYVPVTYGSAQSFVVTDGVDDMLSDVIPLGSFTGLSSWTAGMEFWIRIQVSVASAGNIIMGSRNGAESGCFARNFDPAATTYSDVYGTGDMTLLSGPAGTTVARGYSPMLVGKFVSGDPMTLVVVGDSTVEGAGALGATGVYTKLAAQALGIPMVEVSAGGRDQLDLESNLSGWSAYLALGRVLVDAMGRNDSNANLAYFSYYDAFKTAGGDKIMKNIVFPATSGTFATEAGQTVLRAYPSNVPDTQASEWLKYGAINYIFDAQSIRGTNTAKWAANASTDGTHQSLTGNDLLKTEYQTKLGTVTVT